MHLNIRTNKVKHTNLNVVNQVFYVNKGNIKLNKYFTRVFKLQRN